MKWSSVAKPLRLNAIAFGVGAVVITVIMLNSGFDFLMKLITLQGAVWISAAAVGAIWTAFIMLVTVIVSGYSNTMVQLVTDPPDKEDGTVPAGTHERIVEQVNKSIIFEDDQIADNAVKS